MLQALFSGTPKNSPKSGAPDTAAPSQSNGSLRGYTILALVVGVLFILAFCTGAADAPTVLARAGASLALALGAGVLGAVLGFIFGIPRTLQHDLAPSREPGTAADEQIGYQINTNLEQISDWLTKIIVGVGLIELGRIGGWLMSFSETLGAGFGAGVFGQAFVMGTLIYFGFVGFLFGYLWTRLSFGLAIKAADKGLVERRIEQLEADVRADHQALALVARQLSPRGSAGSVSQDELNAAVAKATGHTKAKMFYDAVVARRDSKLADEAIPVFRALIAADANERFHTNFGQLGYALKDKAGPEWAAAEAALTKAIEIRDRTGEGAFGAYEFNRAVCRIHLGHPKADIVADFQKAAEDNWIARWSLDTPAIQAWLTQNKVSTAVLGFD